MEEDLKKDKAKRVCLFNCDFRKLVVGTAGFAICVLKSIDRTGNIVWCRFMFD